MCHRQAAAATAVVVTARWLKPDWILTTAQLVSALETAAAMAVGVVVVGMDCKQRRIYFHAYQQTRSRFRVCP